MTAKEKILIAARKEFLAKGYERASLREIGRDAGYAANNIYNYWKTKDELFLAVIGRVVIDMASAGKCPEEFALIVERQLTADNKLIKKLSELEPSVLAGML